MRAAQVISRSPRAARLAATLALAIVACRGSGGASVVAPDGASGDHDGSPPIDGASPSDGPEDAAPAAADASGTATGVPTDAAIASDAAVASDARQTPDPLASGLCEGRWCFSHPLPHGNSITAMWGRAADEVWAVGPAGVILHWNGQDWTRAPPRTDRDLVAVWGTGAGHVWVAGGDEIYHFDGRLWTKEQPPPTPDGNPPYFNGLSGTGADDVWVVGHWGMVGHSDGRRWSRVEVGVREDVLTVYARARDDVFIGIGAAGGIPGAGAMRFDGRTWSPTPFSLPGDGRMVAKIHGTGLENLWAYENGVVWRWRESSWMLALGRSRFSSTPVAMFGSSANDLWVVEGGRASRFDGMTWSSVSEGWRTGWTNAPGDTWLGGPVGRTARSDGRTVTELRRGEVGELAAVWSSGGGDALVAGTPSMKLGPNGWARLAAGLPVRALWGRAPNDVWGVTPRSIVHFDGAVWSVVEGAVPRPAEVDLTGITGFGPNDIWAVGDEGVRLHFDGTSWTQESFGRPNQLHAITTAGPNELWAVGTYANHWKRGAPQFWIDEHAPSSMLYAVWAAADDDVWAVGKTASLAHWDGRRWTRFPAPAELAARDFRAVSGGRSDDVWVAGDRGALAHWDGKQWSHVPSGTGDDLVGLWVGPKGDAWLIGKSGSVLHHDAR